MRPCGFTACFTPKHKGWWCLLHCGIYPIESMYAIFTYIWLMFIVNVWYIFDVTYNTLYIYINTIHGSIPSFQCLYRIILCIQQTLSFCPKTFCFFLGHENVVLFFPARQAREFGLWWYNNLTSFNGWLGLVTPLSSRYLLKPQTSPEARPLL